MRPTVYLSGPITGLTYVGATDWRDYAKAVLAPEIDGLSPMRAKDYLAGEQALAAAGYSEKALSCAKGITTRDRYDTTRADLMLVNLLGAERVSIGTMIEFGWADAARVPIVLVMGDGNPHDHAMVREMAGFIVPTLDEGLDIVKAILVP